MRPRRVKSARNPATPAHAFRHRRLGFGRRCRKSFGSPQLLLTLSGIAGVAQTTEEYRTGDSRNSCSRFQASQGQPPPARLGRFRARNSCSRFQASQGRDQGRDRRRLLARNSCSRFQASQERPPVKEWQTAMEPATPAHAFRHRRSGIGRTHGAGDEARNSCSRFQASQVLYGYCRSFR